MADLTVQAIQALKPTGKYKKYNASSGLFVGVATNGEKVFFVRYSVAGVGQVEYRLPKPFGVKSSPAHTTLLEARTKVGELRALGKQGINYQTKLEADTVNATLEASQQQAKSLTVQHLYEAWLSSMQRKDGNKELMRSFNRDILPELGLMKLSDIEESHIRNLLIAISDTGANRTAIVRLNDLKQMFKWGNGRKPWKLLVDDPTCNLKNVDVTGDDYEEVERDRVLSREEIILLAKKIPTARLEKATELVIWIVLSCCTRIGETLKAEWKHIDLLKGEWYIPKVNTKGKSPEHLIYLSSFAIEQFIKLKAISGTSKWCFPNKDDTLHIELRSPTKQIGDRQVSLKDKKPLKNRTKSGDSLVLGVENWTPHDLRRTGATLMQSLDIQQHIIERILNHAELNSMQRIYQQHQYSDLQKSAWDKLGMLISELTLQV